MDIFVTGCINVIVTVAVHRISMWGNDHFNGWRAANLARIRKPGPPGPAQIELPLTELDESIRMIQLRYLAVFSIAYAFQVVIIIYWLSWIAKVMHNV